MIALNRLDMKKYILIINLLDYNEVTHTIKVYQCNENFLFLYLHYFQIS